MNHQSQPIRCPRLAYRFKAMAGLFLNGARPRILNLAVATALLGCASAPTLLAGIAPFATETGKISLSSDAIGTNSASGIVQVKKPAGATVRAAYMLAATTPGAAPIVDGDITLNGAPVIFTSTVDSSFGTHNYLGNVTTLVKATLDSAPAGLVDFTVVENSSKNFGIDGEILTVIFDDPNQVKSNTIILLFGAQNTAGDTFSILLANPIDKTAAGFALDMSLGISFSTSSGQYSQIDVGTNTKAPARLTTSANGADDGEVSNGALITVGGVGDTNDNPADPFATPDTDRYDDELYNLIPFVANGDTTISVQTLNPSNNDNIFFASFFIGANTAIVGEGIVLSPDSATNPVGSPHTVTATVQDTQGRPISQQLVTFSVVSGPNQGLTGSGTTGADGKASFTYTSTKAGTDTIEACFTSRTAQQICSNQVTKTWMGGSICTPATVTLDSPSSGQSFPGGSVVSFIGHYSDHADNERSAHFVVTCNKANCMGTIDGTVNSNGTITAQYKFPKKSAATYTVQLVADDGCGGTTSSGSVSFKIRR